eukprot:TRINITY_DN19491_c0_g2_i1.p1 TRINITY_DN19491_c0_g2~~TRINITY_DN19491_c0_g2_i1.p1  ORF type:complete len:1544 (-),score=322.90 TRINITY_DN19491_c0_g2_i1:163-4794(-)
MAARPAWDTFSDSGASSETEEPVEEAPPEEPPFGAREGLLQSAIFRNVPHSIITEVIDAAPRQRLGPGEVLELKKNGPLLAIDKGAVTVCVADGPAVVLGPGTCFNFVGMLGLAEEAEAFEPAPKRPNRKPEKLAQDIQARRRSCYESVSVVHKDSGPQSVFAERKRTHGSTESRALQAQADDLACFFSLCPGAIGHGAGRERSVSDSNGRSGWLSFNVCGALPGVLPNIGGKPEAYVEGGAELVAVTLDSVLGRFVGCEDDPVMAEQASKFKANLESQSDVWRLILSRAGPAFPAVPPEILWALSEGSYRTVVEPGELIAEEGDTSEYSEALILIAEGDATVEKAVGGLCTEPTRRHCVGRLGPGAMIGDLTLLGTRIPRAASVKAKTEVEITVMPKQALMDLLLRFPGMLHNLSDQLREAATAMQIRLPIRADIISNLRLFSSAESNFVSELASGGERRAYHAGHIVRRQGSTEGRFFAIEYGSVVLEVEGVGRVRELTGGCCFGDPTSLGCPEIDATVRVSTPLALILSVSKGAMQAAFKRNPFETSKFSPNAPMPSERNVPRYLAPLEIFSTEDTSFHEFFQSHVTNRCFLPGMTIILEGNHDAASMFFLRGGSVAVEEAGVRLGDLSIGDTFGELSLVGCVRQRQVTIRALTFSFLLELPRPAFMAALEQFPVERHRIEEVASKGVEDSGRLQHILPGAPQRFLFRLNLYAGMNWYEPGSLALSTPEMKDKAMLIMNGKAALVDAQGNQVEVLHETHSWNVECLLNIETDDVRNYKLVPIDHCEVLRISRDSWEQNLAEFEDESGSIKACAVRAMCSKIARRHLNLDLSSPELVRCSALFKQVSDECAVRLGSKLEPVVFKPGEEILTEGRRGECLYIMMDGTSMLLGANWKTPYGPLKVFGEAEALGISQAYSFTVIASTLCVAMVLSRKSLLEVLEDFPADMPIFEHSFREARKYYSETTLDKVRRVLKKRGNYIKPDFVTQLCRQAEHVFVEPGGTLVDRGEPCKSGVTPMFLLLSGVGKMEGDLKVEVGDVHAGDFCGEGGALGLSETRMLTVRAHGPGLMHCMSVCAAALDDAMKMHGEVREEFEERFFARMEETAEFNHQREQWVWEQVVPVLAGTTLFAKLAPAFLFSVAAPLNEKVFRRGETLVEAGAAWDAMLIVLKGEAKVLAKSGEEVGQLKAGAGFFEANALGLIDVSTATIVASTKLHVLHVTAWTLRRAMHLAEHAVERAALEGLVEKRLEQADALKPLSILAIKVPEGDRTAHIIALQAEEIALDEGEYWDPLPANDPSGQRIGMCVEGRAVFQAVNGNRPIAARLNVGMVFTEGLIHKWGVNVRAVTRCVCYRIKTMDYALAVATGDVGRAWGTSFQMRQKDCYNKLIDRLHAVHGVTVGLGPHPCDPEIHKWRGRRDRCIARSLRTRVARGNLPDLPSRPTTPTLDVQWTLAARPAGTASSEPSFGAPRKPRLLRSSGSASAPGGLHGPRRPLGSAGGAATAPGGLQAAAARPPRSFSDGRLAASAPAPLKLPRCGTPESQ